MRTFISFGILCLALLAQACAGWEPEDEICVNKLHLDRKEIEPLTEKGIHDISNDNYNKYSECYWKEYKMLGDDGEILWDKIEEIFEKKLGTDELNVVVKKCKQKNISGSNVRETVVLTQTCIVETAIKEGLISPF